MPQRLTRRWIVALGAAGLAGCAIVPTTGIWPGSLPGAEGGMGPIRVVVGLVAFAVLIARVRAEWRSSHPTGRPDRGAWERWTAALGFVLVGDVTHVVTPPEAWSWLLIPYALAAAAAYSGLYRLCEVPTGFHQRLREAFESVLITIGFLIVAWVAGVGHAVGRSAEPIADQVASIAGPAVALLVCTSSLLLLLRTPPGNRASLSCLAAGAAAMTVTEAVYGLAALAGSAPRGFTGFLASAATVFAYTGYGIGATLPASRPVERLPAPTPGVRVGSRLWLAPSAAALGLALPALWTGTVDKALLAISGSAIAVHLMHQLFMVVENQRLVEDLDGRVAERTAELAGRERYYRSLYDNAADVVAVIAPDGRFRDHTPSLTTVLGWSSGDLIGRRVDDLFASLGCDQALAAYLRVRVGQATTESVRDRLPHTDGSSRDVEIHLSNHLDDPVINGVVATYRDITAQCRLEEELLHQAFHDPLTSLANRALFRSTAERSMRIASARGQTVSVLLLDLDGFKGVNDTFGHPVGDDLLIEFAQRMSGIARLEDTVARLGGDEFAFLVEPGLDPDVVADAVLAQLDAPFSVEGRDVAVSASIGIADSTHAETVDDLLRNADVAMYESKQQGPACRAVRFEPSMHEASVRRLQTLTDLRHALDGDGLDVWLQPVVDLRSRAVIGYEALVRWNHPERGLVYPGEFIGLAEDSGLIGRVGDFVLRHAVGLLAEHRHAGGAPSWVSVNISARQFDDPELADQIQAILEQAGLDADALTIEITESTVMRDPEAARLQLGRLTELGVRVALDDFGTGYSSLAALARFPLDVLKVDRSFVAALGDDSVSAEALLAAIEEIARALGLRLVAEGVEREEEREALQALGFSFGQGYLFGAPGPALEVLPAPAPHDTGSHSADSHGAHAHPADSHRAHSHPARSRPADSRPADSRPADSRPADSRPADSGRGPARAPDPSRKGRDR
jgi:diguanylate cyclase (GGDEF)-like protein/PAS domain S-box-containing protein